jgi:inhibitor of KinA
LTEAGPPTFRLAGDRALLVEMGQAIEPEISGRVQALARLARGWAGVEEAVPGYATLLLLYDPRRTQVEDLERRVEHETLTLRTENLPAARTVRLPVAYGGAFGPDLEALARHCGLAPEEVVRLHSNALYTVYMIGFTPGFPYLGGLPPELATPRLATPRTRVPAGSVGIAGTQTGVYPLESPGGWRLIGRTPTPLFDPNRNPPALLRAGDRLRFWPIPVEYFLTLAESVRRDEPNWEVEE